MPWDAQEVRRRVDMMDAAVPPWGWPNNVLGNHDEHRLASRFGKENARTAAMPCSPWRHAHALLRRRDRHDRREIPPELEQDPVGHQHAGAGLGRDPEAHAHAVERGDSTPASARPSQSRPGCPWPRTTRRQRGRGNG
ncbi:MAG: hypothetical protein R2838_00050 [Caldilineaceae bacterium]